VSVEAFAQKRNVYFLKNDGARVKTKDSADYIRIVSEPDSGTVLYNVKDYYLDGKLKLIGKSSEVDPPVFEGQCVTFFSSGKRKSIIGFKSGYMDGDSYQYYPNGKPYVIRRYSTTFTNGRPYFDDMIVTCNDSAGKAMVINGNGHFIDFDDEFKLIIAEGDVVNGKPDGDWIRKQILTDKINGNDSITFKDHYIKGVFAGSTNISVIYKRGDSSQVFKPVEVQPEFIGGEAALAKFLQRNIRYPVFAKENNIAGKVYIQFVVERDGSITDIKVIRSPHDVISQEAIRVMNLSPKWQPGMQGGPPVRVVFTFPINFSLGDAPGSH
jgi:TonB family protein